MDFRPPKGVRRIVLVARDEQGVLQPTTLFEAERPKGKKGSRGIRQVEGLVRRVTRAQQAMIDTYRDRHERSNRKRRDGWLGDLIRNVFKAGASGLRKLV
jgi:hypothetical protein